MDFLFGDENKKIIQGYEGIISEIKKYRQTMMSLSDDDLKLKTSELRERFKDGESLDSILPVAYALVREASRRFLGKEQRDVQLMGAIALHNGDIAQMKTGEGKTLTAPLAAYLNALTGEKVHIATSNDYLASRDCEELRPLFEGLGLTVGVVTEKRLSDGVTDLERRKKAYSSDITYGSGNAFAFDYLRDNTAKDLSQVVRGVDRPGFIIIDEADQILVNDAVMPFKLSGTVEQSKGISVNQVLANTLAREEKEKAQRIYSGANSFIYKLFKDKAHCKQFQSKEIMDVFTGGNKEESERVDREFSILYCRGEDAILTERGWLEVFRYFKDVEISKAINKNIEVITKDPSFREDVDYTFDGDRLSLTLKGLEKAVREVDSIRTINNEFYSSSDFVTLNHALTNALKAHFVLEKGKDYILENSTKDGITKKKVLLVANGRTQDGRVYGGGLQQAIEFKEKRLNEGTTQIEMTNEHDELASISQKAFYSIYPKIAGMTGTSSKELFEEVYGMLTVDIPKHSEYKKDEKEVNEIYSGRIDKDTVLFETDREKLEAVIKSVLESREKGQPVLIATTSVSESNKLYEEFQKRGIPCEKLNAENAEKESKIISKAGTKGAVTISTQMAGRGTDIKLGGEFEDCVERLIEFHVDNMVRNVASNRKTNMSIEDMMASARSFLETQKMEEIRKDAQTMLDKERQELIASGGLKVIGYSHFSTKRDDNQLRGRAARQADPGVTEFYSSVNDLRQTLGVSRKKIEELHKMGLQEGSSISGVAVEKIINEAQSSHEGLMNSMIASTQEVDYNLSIMRNKIYAQRTRMITGEDVKRNMEFIIDSSIVNIIDRNLPVDVYAIGGKRKVNSSGLDVHNFIIDMEETFGIDLTSEFEENRFRTISDIVRYSSIPIKKRYEQLRKQNGDEVQDEIDRGKIVGTIDNAWREFNNNLEDIRFQNRLNALVQNKDYDEILAMKKGFNKEMADSKISMMASMFGKKSTKTRKTATSEEMSEDIENINDYYVEQKRPSKNLIVRPAKIVAALSNKIKLIKEKIAYQFELVPLGSEEIGTVENIDFEEKSQGGMSSKK